MIFQCLSYSEAIQTRLEELKKTGFKINFSKLAAQMRIQRSYLSSVIYQKKHLSSDQLYRACEALKFGDDEREFLLLLLEWEKTQIQDRKAKLDSQINEIRSRKSEISEVLSARSAEAPNPDAVTKYYLDPFHQIVHVGLTIPDFLKSPESLRQLLGLSRPRYEQILIHLESMGVIAQSPLRVLVSSLHLERSHALFEAWISGVREIFRMRQLQTKNPESYEFSVVFSASPSVRSKIQSKLLELLKEVEKEVERAESKQLYFLSFDLAGWNSDNV